MNKPGKPGPPRIPNQDRQQRMVGAQMQSVTQTQQFKIEQSPLPNGETLDGLARHIDRVGERWMTVFEEQVKHEQFMARDQLRVNEELNRKALDTQAAAVSGDNKRLLLAQIIVGALLLLGLIAFLAIVAAAAWFFYYDKPIGGSLITGVAGVFGYYFKNVVKAYMPSNSQPKK